MMPALVYIVDTRHADYSIYVEYDEERWYE
jgi:hypothetical protein